MGNVNLPTPVALAGGALCALGGYLLGVVAGPDTAERTTAVVESFDEASNELCLSGDDRVEDRGDGRVIGRCQRDRDRVDDGRIMKHGDGTVGVQASQLVLELARLVDRCLLSLRGDVDAHIRRRVLNAVGSLVESPLWRSSSRSCESCVMVTSVVGTGLLHLRS